MTKKSMFLTVFAVGAVLAVVGAVVVAKKVGMICTEDDCVV